MSYRQNTLHGPNTKQEIVAFYSADEHLAILIRSHQRQMKSAALFAASFYCFQRRSRTRVTRALVVRRSIRFFALLPSLQQDLFWHFPFRSTDCQFVVIVSIIVSMIVCFCVRNPRGFLLQVITWNPSSSFSGYLFCGGHIVFHAFLPRHRHFGSLSTNFRFMYSDRGSHDDI